MDTLRRHLDAYWNWLATKPDWHGMTANEIRANYFNFMYDEEAYERLFRQMRERANALIDHVTATTRRLTEEQLANLLEAILVDNLGGDVMYDCVTRLEAPAPEQLLVAGTRHWSSELRCLCLMEIPAVPFATGRPC